MYKRFLEIVMAAFTLRRFAVYAAAVAGFLIMGFRFYQGDASSVVDSFPAWLIAPLLLGMLAHWAKGYTRGTIQGSLWSWWANNFGLTISAVIAGIGQLFGAWESGMIPTDVYWLLQFWAVFNIGYVSDSAIIGQKKT